MSEEDSCYSNDEEYFLDVCRSGDMDELTEFIDGMPKQSTFNWSWFNNKNDNFMHMLAANNLYAMFDYLLPVIRQRCPKEQIQQIVNKTNSLGSSPLHYTVITESKEMIARLLQLGADPNIRNQQGRTAFEEAEKFGKIQIAEILAPVSANNLQELKQQIQGMKLNDDSSDEQGQPLQEIQQKQETEQKMEQKQ